MRGKRMNGPKVNDLMKDLTKLTPIETVLTKWLLVGSADAIKIQQVLGEINPLLAEGVVMMAELVMQKLGRENETVN